MKGFQTNPNKEPLRKAQAMTQGILMMRKKLSLLVVLVICDLLAAIYLVLTLLKLFQLYSFCVRARYIKEISRSS